MPIKLHLWSIQRNRKFFYFSVAAPQNSTNDAPPPPERGSSYAVMSQQSALRSNGSTASNLPPSSQPASMKKVSFHDSNANSESILRNVTSGTSNPPSITMDTIREDPNVSHFLRLISLLRLSHFNSLLFYRMFYFGTIVDHFENVKIALLFFSPYLYIWFDYNLSCLNKIYRRSKLHIISLYLFCTWHVI